MGKTLLNLQNIVEYANHCCKSKKYIDTDEEIDTRNILKDALIWLSNRVRNFIF